MNFDLDIENINYLKIGYKDRNNFTHYIKAAIRFINEHEILASIKTEQKPDIEIPANIDLSIVSDNGIYKAKTILKRFEPESPYYLLSLKKPEELDYQQKREYFRVKLQENVTISFETENGIINIPAISYDISANGIRIELDEYIEFPEDVMLELHFAKRNLSVKAKFVRTDEEDNIKKASFRFVNLTEQDADYIFQVCFNKQIEDRRKR